MRSIAFNNLDEMLLTLPMIALVSSTIRPLLSTYTEPEKNYVFIDSSNTRDSKPYDLHTLIDRLQKIEAILGNVEKLGFSDMEYGWQRLTYLSVDAKEKEITFDTDC